MRGPEWDEPKCSEMNKLEKMDAFEWVCADDPRINGCPVVNCIWAGRCKRNPDGSILKMNARCCGRGDLDQGRLNLSSFFQRHHGAGCSQLVVDVL